MGEWVRFYKVIAKATGLSMGEFEGMRGKEEESLLFCSLLLCTGCFIWLINKEKLSRPLEK
ncbi:MAG: hypothetical protein D3920_01695 [Candidatus Electrothrix sp. AW2]|nr:hypothetical protein [Candidatus Electrothrix gigas]